MVNTPKLGVESARVEVLTQRVALWDWRVLQGLVHSAGARWLTSAQGL
jgi:hypothetical protein